jgi:hypothetical protein
MSPSEADRVLSLDDFVDFLAGVEAEGIAAVVIGGLAVGAYARQLGQSVLSADIDLYTDHKELGRLVDWARRQGAVVRKMPQARAIPVAFVEWQGLEVNILTESQGLPSAEAMLRGARVFHPRSRPGVSILVADPFDLLANKLRVNREKDRPHIHVLLGFVEQELVSAMRDCESQRDRLMPARRYLEVTAAHQFPVHVAAQLVPLARTPVDYRFLVNHVGAVERQQLIGRAPAELRDELRRISAATGA